MRRVSGDGARPGPVERSSDERILKLFLAGIVFALALLLVLARPGETRAARPEAAKAGLR